MPSAQPCINPELIAKANAAIAGLQAARLSIVTAESCTAGLLTAALSQAEGAGDVLQGGFVTYAKVHKTRALGVDAALLAREGAVCKAVVNEMLSGALRNSSADIAIAVSGVLGPSPDEDGNPVGRVVIGVQRRDLAPTTLEHNYGQSHHDVLRHRVVMQALNLLHEAIR
jgi:nicotinamide-nucleotide amidase